ncbi:hypothetical protein EK904_011817, partial [Melospiza melodia maxima]
MPRWNEELLLSLIGIESVSLKKKINKSQVQKLHCTGCCQAMTPAAAVLTGNGKTQNMLRLTLFFNCKIGRFYDNLSCSRNCWLYSRGLSQLKRQVPLENTATLKCVCISLNGRTNQSDEFQAQIVFCIFSETDVFAQYVQKDHFSLALNNSTYCYCPKNIASFLKEQQPECALLRGCASKTNPAYDRGACLLNDNYSYDSSVPRFSLLYAIVAFSSVSFMVVLLAWLSGFFHTASGEGERSPIFPQ